MRALEDHEVKSARSGGLTFQPLARKLFRCNQFPDIVGITRRQVESLRKQVWPKAKITPVAKPVVSKHERQTEPNVKMMKVVFAGQVYVRRYCMEPICGTIITVYRFDVGQVIRCALCGTRHQVVEEAEDMFS